MATNKTIPTSESVKSFLDAIPDQKKKQDCYTILEWMQEITEEPPVMWGPAIVGFGTYHYKYDSGREGDMLLTGFSPRKQNITLYIMAGFNRYDDLMPQLGKFKTGKSCLYIKKLEDVDTDILKALIATSYNYYRDKYKSKSQLPS